jgi:TolB-like protein/DNA-binding winged helix-turn-helix (wHTH) protein/tetratricopeptide (TPR) repeat protein
MLESRGQSVHIQRRDMEVLVCLASHAGSVVTTDELVDEVWKGAVVADGSIYKSIRQLRHALADDARRPKYIKTVPTRGYQLVAAVSPVGNPQDLPVTGIQTSGTQRHRYLRASMMAAIVVIAMSILLLVYDPARKLIAPTAGPDVRSIAVLPFVDMSNGGGHQYKGDGIAEELIHVLSNLPDTRVTARTSSFAFRDSDEDIRSVGKKLNAAMILEGSIRIDNEIVHVTAQLIETESGYHRWSHTFDLPVSDLSAIPGTIAALTAESFGYSGVEELEVAEASTLVGDVRAYDHYLLGLLHLRAESASDLMLAVEYFERAIELDPGFARAYSGLAESYTDLYWFEEIPDYLDKAESAVDHALTLDNESADAFRVLGILRAHRQDHTGAEAAYLEAIERNPNDVRTISWLADTYWQLGKMNEATGLLEAALQHNPWSGLLNNRLGYYHSIKPDLDLDKAFEYFERAMDYEPDYPYSYFYAGLIYNSIGQIDKALPYLLEAAELTAGPSKISLSDEVLQSVYIKLGNHDAAAELLRRMKKIEPDSAVSINAEIQFLIANNQTAEARFLLHSLLTDHLHRDEIMGLLAAYELLIGDTAHAEALYLRLNSAKRADSNDDSAALFQYKQLKWGMLGAVNLAYLYVQKQELSKAQALLDRARAFVESSQSSQVAYKLAWFAGSATYVQAQIAAIEGDRDAAIRLLQQAVDEGWTRVWFTRVDPIMQNISHDSRFQQTLNAVEQKLDLPPWNDSA